MHTVHVHVVHVVIICSIIISIHGEALQLGILLIGSGDIIDYMHICKYKAQVTLNYLVLSYTLLSSDEHAYIHVYIYCTCHELPHTKTLYSVDN